MGAARSLLIAALCPVCGGTGRVVYVRDGQDLAAERLNHARRPWSRAGWRCECDGGYKWLPYPDFTEQFVAGWGDEWVMSQAAVLTWLDQRREEERPADCRGWIAAGSP